MAQLGKRVAAILLRPSLLAAAGAAAAVAAGALGGIVGGRAGALALVFLQGLGLACWFGQAAVLRRSWATAAFVTGAAWVALFAIPSFVYAVAPRYLHGFNATGAIAVVDVSLFAMLLGQAFGLRGARDSPGAVRLALGPGAGSVALAVRWFVVGVVGLAILIAHAGGLRAYLHGLGSTAGLNAGLFYVVSLVLALRIGPTAAITVRWAARTPVGRALWMLLLAGMGLIAITGARAFVAVGAVQLLLLFAVLRRPPLLRRTAPIAVLGAVLLVFGVGTIKRYETYTTQHPTTQRSFGDYAVHIAPGEALDAYVNNYVDSVRLIAVARSIVPGRAPYEGVRPLEELALKPIPSGLRPELHRNRQIAGVFDPQGAFAYAEPLQVTAFLAGGPLAVLLAFVLLGWGIARLDRWLATPAIRHPGPLAAAVAAAVQVPVLIRSGIPNGVAFLAIEVIGAGVVTAHVARSGRLSRSLRVRRATSARSRAGRA